MFSIMTNSDFRLIITNRLTKDNNMFFVDAICVMSKYGFDVIKRKKYYGIALNSKIILNPIFDHIEVLTNDIAIVKIKNLLALFSIKRNTLLTEFEFKTCQAENSMAILTNQSDRIILYDLSESRFLHRQGDYDEFNLKNSSTEYLWAKRNRFYDYINRKTGRVISLPGIIMAYDTKTGIWGLDEYQRVSAFDEFGVEDLSMTRTIVKDNAGYLTLSNYTYNIEHIIDIYGNILNI